MAFFECTIGGGGDGSTLTVTCYSGFAGLTISITNGVDTFSDVCPSTSPYEVVFEGLANGTWNVSTVYGGQTYTKTVEINNSTTFNPIPNGATVTPINNIQTWLHCADIWDKNYTTIGQVLADASTLQALIASNNAADYMARSTTWANSVTANANAMTYIGANDYCANKLLANSTWLNAICNSTYFESVLNVKVPTMTSNTAPYGEASASSTWQNVSAYYAFDNDDSHSFGTASGNTTGYVQYKFVNPTNVRKVRITNRAKNNYKDFRIQASNDNSNWITLYTGTNPSNNENYVNEIAIANDEFFLCYRLQMDTAYQNDGSFVYVGCKKLQFYGRTAQ